MPQIAADVRQGVRRECREHGARPTSIGWELDDRVRAYLTDASRRFYVLRKLVAELGGLLLLGVMDSRRDAHIDQVEHQVAADLAEVAELLVPRPPQACVRLHGYLASAAGHLAKTYTELLRGAGHGWDVASAQAALGAALADLRRASDLLPGADLVDRSSACCGLGDAAALHR